MKVHEQVWQLPAGVGVAVLADGVVVVGGREYPRGSTVCVTSTSLGTVAVSVWDAETVREDAVEGHRRRVAELEKRKVATEEQRIRRVKLEKQFKWKKLSPFLLDDGQMRTALLKLVQEHPGMSQTWYVKKPPYDGGVRGDDGRKWKMLSQMLEQGILKRVQAKKPNRRLKYVLEVVGDELADEQQIKEAA